ncbi:MAG: LysR family transcriptional regulator [Rhodospirillaceae bacterium]|nr:LysR family transcriptional regulator [Rhodospirillaceae bacterium]MBT5458461.1 LysR family transcriptional regulator [Rhodospirillaceae bacterium]
MNIRQLECFREILVTGTVTGAAKALGISQPSASSLIANLERELGFALFKRARGRLEATPEAQYLSSDIQRTLDSLELTTQRAEQIRDQRVGNLVIATYPDIAIDFLPKVISRFRDDRPELRVTILARRSEMMRGLLPTQLYDLAIVEWSTEHPSVEMEGFQFDCVCAMPENHPLARRRKIRPGDLDGLPFVSLLPEHEIYAQTEQAFAAHGADLNIAVETQTMESVSAFIRHGAGVGLLDPLTAKRYVGDGLIVRPFEPSIPHKIALVLPRDRLRSVILEEFIASLKAAFAALDS